MTKIIFPWRKYKDLLLAKNELSIPAVFSSMQSHDPPPFLYIPHQKNMEQMTKDLHNSSPVVVSVHPLHWWIHCRHSRSLQGWYCCHRQSRPSEYIAHQCIDRADIFVWDKATIIVVPTVNIIFAQIDFVVVSSSNSKWMAGSRRPAVSYNLT